MPLSTRKDDFAVAFKNLARYRSENNFINFMIIQNNSTERSNWLLEPFTVLLIMLERPVHNYFDGLQNYFLVCI